MRYKRCCSVGLSDYGSDLDHEKNQYLPSGTGKVGLASEVVGEDSQCVVRRVSGE